MPHTFQSSKRSLNSTMSTCNCILAILSSAFTHYFRSEQNESHNSTHLYYLKTDLFFNAVPIKHDTLIFITSRIINFLIPLVYTNSNQQFNVSGVIVRSTKPLRNTYYLTGKNKSYTKKKFCAPK